jgi:Tol biopolymer transport system component
MNTASGEVRKIPLDSSENVFVGDISDDGAWILLTRDTPTKDNEICFISSQGGRAQAVSQGLNPKWADKDQRILFYRGATSGVASKSGKFEVCSINRDGSDLRVIYTDTGVPLMLSGSFYPSPDGKSLATIKWGHDYGADVVRYDLDTGKESQVTFTRSYIDEVFWTKNNYIIYSSNQSGNFELWMCPAEGGESIQLTRSSGGELDGHLSSDGKKLLYLERTWPTNVKSVNLATGQITALTSDDFTRVLYDISPDNRFVVTSVPEYSPWPSPQTSRGIQLMDLAKKESSFNLFKDKKLGSPVLGGWSLAWSPDGKWIACVRRADSLEEEMKICVFSPSGPTGLKVIGGGGVDSSGLGPVRLRWVDENTLVWFSFFQKKSWISSIDHPDPRQYYKDSTAAFPIQGGKFVLFRDFRVAGRPWYVDTAPHSGNRTALKRISGVGDQLSLAPSGEFLLYRDGRGDLHKVLLPGGTDQRLPYRVRGLGPITRDGKEMLYREGRMVGKLLLVENPLIWE